ncbi:MAG: 16S rRNA (adenine(1518)-N(6)/adenine(1519)-N(6))-dimethyltransferase RsmA [candidate division WOR-3 bacterium]
MAKRRLGQHFLNSNYVARKIVNFAELQDECVIEIGAGKGMLTRELAKKARTVYAIEIDRLYAASLIEKNIPNVKVITTNFLDFDMSDYKSAVIVGNIPYSITTRIVEKLVRDRDKFSKAILTIQREYAERLVAKPGSPQYGAITCYVNYYFEIVKGFNIPPRFFSPAPKVSSTVIGLIHKEKPFLLENDSDFFEFIKGIFRYRRKILKNSLANFIGFTPHYMGKQILTKRPEQLELREFFHLYMNLRVHSQ